MSTNIDTRSARALDPALRAKQAAQAADRQKKVRRKQRIPLLWKTIASVAIFLASVFPIYWMVSSSLLSTSEIRSATPTFFPLNATLENFKTVFQVTGSLNFPASLKTSLLVTLMTLVLALIFGFLAALASTRFRWFGRKSFIVTILIIQMIPGEAMLISIFRMLDGWHMTNSIIGLGLVYVASVVPFTIWTLRGFVHGMPAELEESAQIDGCTKMGAFFRITFPLLAPGLVATGIFAFIQAWNEFVVALVVMNRPESKTLPLWLNTFMGQNKGTDWGAIMAGSVLMTLPVMIFFLFVQGRMANGLMSGAVKG